MQSDHLAVLIIKLVTLLPARSYHAFDVQISIPINATCSAGRCSSCAAYNPNASVWTRLNQPSNRLDVVHLMIIILSQGCMHKRGRHAVSFHRIAPHVLYQ
ncbi:hypothetical protein HBI25_161130 [Parastagonospora nodorum]|nr:hypothetical protein HBH52_224740 [Parastagonospora nodorum]KAH3995322.1 hypothetical protein HBI10_173820 [Parastagonospora nodorum]KAH4016075.1 hypothetical protein HBI13_152940 [Parastagonospora nodorum]KAH4100890.1 hypothetical protein HBH46_147780 [Parastagonospora nodorum]KAH4117411.1 hypothetical protein HBH47_154910 [Parastagonospora nodorum]